MTILDTIVETKHAEVSAAKAKYPLASLRDAAHECDSPRDFYAVITSRMDDEIRLIAEIKKASPSAGLIVPDFDPVRIARTYAQHGAIAISVLTDESYFQGRLDYIGLVKQTVPLPVLRKDFMIDEYQIYEARAAGADAVLLIAEILDPEPLTALFQLSTDLGMSTLVEVHSEDSLRSVLSALGPPVESRYLLGINNRNLATQTTDLSTMSRLASLLPPQTRFVAESGIATREDAVTAQRSGACAMLVGESILRSPDLGAKIDEILDR
jgi:indole-3-glycerol phosphate synthase